MSRFVRLTDWNGQPTAINRDLVATVQARGEERCDLYIVSDAQPDNTVLTVQGTLDEIVALLNDEEPVKAHPNAIGWELTPEHPSNVHPSNRTPGPPAWATKPRATEVQP